MHNYDIDLIVKTNTILTIDQNNTVLSDMAILIKDGIIIDIIKNQNCEKLFPNVQTINSEDKIVMPGFINTHTHIPMAYFKGMADDLPLEKWLNEYIWPAEKKNLSPSFVYEASLHGISELIKNGITFFNDSYFFPDETVKACQEIGIRATIGLLDIEVKLNCLKTIENILANIKEKIDFASKNPLIDFSISPHSVYACSEQKWKINIDTAHKYNLLIHTHLSESAIEVENCLKEYGKLLSDF